MEHIEKMKKELEELEIKLENLEKFVEKEIEEHKFTDEIQRIKLSCQAEHMHSYAKVLKERIKYDTEKFLKENHDCYVGNNYDEVAESCGINTKE